MNSGREKAYIGKYTLEKIYDLVGRNDYTSTITFRSNSQSEKLYGNTLTIVFLYTQQEREELEDNIKKGVVGKHGYVRAKYLLFDLPDTKIKLILEPAKLTEEENAVIYDANGKMNEDIAYVYLGYKCVTLNISKEEIIELMRICQNRYTKRMAILDERLYRMTMRKLCFYIVK